MTPASRIDRIATWVIGAALLLVPLAHGALSEPFILPKEIVVLTAALLLSGLAILSHFTEEEASGLISPALVLAGAFLVFSALAVLPAANRWLAAGTLIDFAAQVTIFWGVTRFVRHPAGVGLLLRVTLIAAALVSLGTILQVFVPGLTLSLAGVSILPPSRAGATLGDAGLAAQFLILAFPAGLGAAAMSRGPMRLVWGGCLGLVAAALLFAGRPEGWIMAALTVAFVVTARVLQVACSDRRWSRLAPDLSGESLRAVLVALIVMILALAISRSPSLLRSDVPAVPLEGVALLSPTTGDPQVDRGAAARGTFALLRRHPAGVGPGNWRHAFLEVAWTAVSKSPFTLSHQARHAGNDFLERLSEIGLLGGLVFFLLIVTLLVQSWLAAIRAPEPWAAAGFAAFTALAATCATAFLGSPFEEPAPALLFWTLAGVVQVSLAQAAGDRPLLLRLRPRMRPIVPRAVRRRAAGWAAVVLWLAATAGFGDWTWNRLVASRLILVGQSLFYSGRYEQALLAFGRPAARRSPDPLARAWAGEAYLRLGFNDLAAREFGEALARSPWFVAAFLGRAATFQAAGRYDLAQNDLESALRIWPDNVDTRLALARLDAVRGMPDAALDEYREIIKLSQQLAEPYFHMGEIFLRRGQIDEAIEAYRVCGMKNPHYPKLQLNMGDAFFQKGLLEMALRAYESAASNDTKDVQARLKIANTQHAMNNFCEAKATLEAARDLEPNPTRRQTILDLIKRVEPECVREQKKQRPRGR